ncbi:MAG: hypothetical protein DMG93_01470 [Acidobacteria bacterium]|nr:MAG: hypothetical protein DMG93_01470 [Acidobacteriota bacterium]
MMRNLVGLTGVILLPLAFIVPSLHRPVLYLAVQISALSCSIIAVRISRKWLALTAASALLTAQAIVAIVIEG